jgi:hypothetical protein
MQLPTLLLAVLVAAAVVAVVFLIRLLIQLRATAEEAGKTLVEVRELAQNLSELDLEIKARIEETGDTLGVFRKAAVDVSRAALVAAWRFLPAPAKFLALILPAARYVARQIKQAKENHHVE